MPLRGKPRRRLFFAHAKPRSREELFFYPQITQINADYGGMSCRCAASLAAGYCLLTRSREAAKNYFFYPQITQINADFGGMSCRCAAIHAAGYFLLTRSREAAKKTKAPAT